MTEPIHQKHEHDKFPICWRIDQIVRYKRDNEGVGTIVTTRKESVTCHFCRAVRAGGHTPTSGYTSSSGPQRALPGIVQARTMTHKRARFVGDSR